MKRLTGIAITLLVAGTLWAQTASAPKGLDERLFGAFIHFRADLGLTDEQNIAADELLNEMKEAAIAIRERERAHAMNALASFLSDDFDPRLMLPLPEEVRDEIRHQYNVFMAQHTLALHDLLTPEQRQLLVDLMLTPPESE